EVIDGYGETLTVIVGLPDAAVRESCNRILKVERTIADLAGADEITSEHLSETLQYRTLDRQLWG
ncbi:MAG: magnesium chelatase, partial [Verrucomicrobiota bacterium]|nr:magnesium chelatase [Verrucomicrobiota bacterium]